MAKWLVMYFWLNRCIDIPTDISLFLLKGLYRNGKKIFFGYELKKRSI